jgi:hypothetical protein
MITLGSADDHASMGRQRSKFGLVSLRSGQHHSERILIMVMSEVAVDRLKERSQLDVVQFGLQRAHQRLERKPRVLNVNQAVPKRFIESARMLAQRENIIMGAEFDDLPSCASWIVLGSMYEKQA